MSEALLSICIPTCKRENIVRQLLESIISQDVDTALFEICITDNSETDETKNLIEECFSEVSNLHYKKVSCKGYLNSIEALHFGTGKYIKLHNDYSILENGAIRKMLEQIKEAEKKKSYIFFSFGKVKDVQGIASFDRYDDFMRSINYQATWSSAFGIWKSELERIDQEGIEPNYMYPHTSYLHRITNCGMYIVDNNCYAYNAELEKKGGYNLVDSFVRIYLGMVKEDLLQKGHISKITYNEIEDGILRFCAEWFNLVRNQSDRYTFTFRDDEKIVEAVCGKNGRGRYKKYKKIIAIKNRIPVSIKQSWRGLRRFRK